MSACLTSTSRQTTTHSVPKKQVILEILRQTYRSNKHGDQNGNIILGCKFYL